MTNSKQSLSVEEALGRVRKRIASYETGLRMKAFEVGDNPLSDGFAADLRVVIAEIDALRARADK